MLKSLWDLSTDFMDATLASLDKNLVFQQILPTPNMMTKCLVFIALAATTVGANPFEDSRGSDLGEQFEKNLIRLYSPRTMIVSPLFRH